ncbi:MAG: DUF3313 family protein [Sphingomicrobium sp.]
MRLAIVLAACASLALGLGSAAAKAPTTWDGLVQVKSKRLDLVYLQPGADFRGYTKVIVAPTEVSFAKNWARDYNRTSVSLSSRVSEKEVQDTITKGVQQASEIFANAWTKGGYQLVTEPGPDVLLVKTGVLNVEVKAPETNTTGRSYTFSGEAGQATLFVEARDSQTGALLGRAVDHRIIGDNNVFRRTAMSNRADFRDQVTDWANISVRGMTELKSLSPIRQ